MPEKQGKSSAPPTILRLVIVHLLQLPSVFLLCFATSPWAWYPAVIWGSVVCCAGTDSHWRWLNRMLVAEAVVWLVLGLSTY
ncbi:MAG: hypothetical protein AAB263_04135 [Planctomycetota bacterium]